MKGKLLLCLSALSAACLLFGLAGCKDNPEEHVHAWGEWTQTRAASCEAAGEEMRICAEDPTHTETRELPATGHAYGAWEIVKEADCEVAGEEVRICANDAEHIETREIPALGHSYRDNICERCGAAIGSIGLLYEETGDGYTVTGLGTCTDATLRIPTEYNNKPVIGIAAGAFRGSDLESVILPDSVREVGDEAFADCARLTRVTLGSDAAPTRGIEALSWGRNEGLLGMLLGDRVFAGCSLLAEVEVGARVVGFGGEVFAECEALLQFTVSAQNGVFSDRNGVLLSRDGTELYCYPAGRTEEVYRVPTGVERVASGAFFGCEALLRVVLSETVKALDENAFVSCPNLESLTIEGRLELLPDGVILHCEALADVYYAGTEGEWQQAQFELSADISLHFGYRNEHTHQYRETVTAASCTHGGYTRRVCELCGDEEVTDQTPALGHAYTSHVVEPTCETAGYTQFLCSRCGAEYRGQYVSPLGHTYAEHRTEPTCDTAGYTEQICTRCAASGGRTELPALGHAWGEWQTVRAATCEAAGKAERICANDADHVETQALPALGHNYVSYDVASTCEAAGYTRYICVRCGNAYNGESFPIAGHAWGEWQTVTAATCEAAGEERRVCANNSSHAETREIPALGHEYVGGVCTHCGEEEPYSQGLLFAANETGTEYSVVGYEGSDLDVVIPAEHDGLPVTAIQGGFWKEGIRSVTLPASIRALGEGSLRGDIEKIFDLYYKGTLADWLGISFEGNMDYCWSAISYWGYYGGYYNLYIGGEKVVDLVIPENIPEIPPYAFYNCNSLKSVTIPKSVQAIGENAFGSNEYVGVTGYVKLDPVDVYYEGMLSDWLNLTFIEPEAPNNSFSYVGIGAHMLYFGGELVTSLVIPGSVESIPAGVFAQCKSLREIRLEEGVKRVGAGAFHGCDRVEYAFIPGTVTEFLPARKYLSGIFIGGNFENCSNLKVELGEGLTEIFDYMFYRVGFSGTSDIAFELEIPNSVTKIGANAFRECRTLKEIALPDNVKEIDAEAFYNCSALTTVDLGSVETIGLSAFSVCGALEEITIPESVTEIQPGAFEISGLRQIIIPDTVVRFGEKTVQMPYEPEGGVFANCLYLTEAKIGNGVRILPHATFSGCTSLTTVDLGSVEVIEYYAFFNCSALEEITIPESVTEIQPYAFDLSGLRQIVIPDTVVRFGEEIQPGVFDWEKQKGNVFARCYDLTDVKLGSGVRILPEYTFEHCLSLTTVDLGSVEVIGYGAFSGCSALEEITIPESVTEIQREAFAGSGLRRIVIPDTVVSFGEVEYSYIGSGVFANCENLTDVKLGRGIQVLPAGTFEGCTSLTSIELSFETIPAYAFSGLSLTSITLGSGLQSLDPHAFASCSLEEIHYAGSAEQWAALAQGAYIQESVKIYFNGE